MKKHPCCKLRAVSVRAALEENVTNKKQKEIAVNDNQSAIGISADHHIAAECIRDDEMVPVFKRVNSPVGVYRAGASLDFTL
jgi:hypothetical protein